MIRKLLCLVVGAAFLVMVAGCTPETGVVTKVRHSYVCARSSAGQEGCQKMRHDVAKRCHVGDRWPDCKEKP